MRLIALCVFLIYFVPAWAEAPRLAPDSDADAILDALHARGDNLSDFSADVALHTTDNRTGEDTAQIGNVTYQKRGQADSRIRVGFDTKQTDNGSGKITQKQKLDYLLQDGWLADRDYQKKLEVRRQVLEPGQKMNLLKLGEGPFPLPIGQPRDEVKKQFKVTRVASAKEDPRDTVHVKLEPLPKSQLEKKFTQIDVFVDTKTNMPVRIDTTEPSGTARSTELTNVKLNTGVKDEAFALPNIDNEGWNRREEPFR